MTDAEVDAAIRSLHGYSAGVEVFDSERKLYRAGIVAGMRRAAELVKQVPDEFGTLADASHNECARVAALVIRAAADKLEQDAP